MAAELGVVEGDDDQVARSLRDLLVAAWAAVRLAGLERMDPPDLDRLALYLGIRAHSRRPTVTTTAAATKT